MGSEEQQKRQVACKVRINSLITGKYVKEEGWTPNYVITSEGLKVSRVNLIGGVVDIPAGEGEGFQSIVIDDGSARISVRDFEKGGILKGATLGEIILLVGKPREYGGEKYIIPEIIRKIEDKRWIEARKIELQMQQKSNATEQKQEAGPVNEGTVEIEDVGVAEDEPNKGVFEQIIKYINKTDKGDGVDLGDVLKSVGGVSEENVAKLLREGELFEVRPGRLKTL